MVLASQRGAVMELAGTLLSARPRSIRRRLAQRLGALKLQLHPW
jgi:hypothetical protein